MLLRCSSLSWRVTNPFNREHAKPRANEQKLTSQQLQSARRGIPCYDSLRRASTQATLHYLQRLKECSLINTASRLSEDWGDSMGANAVPKSLVSGDYADAESATKEAGPAMESFLQSFLGAEIVKTFAFWVRSSKLFCLKSKACSNLLIWYCIPDQAPRLKISESSQRARMLKFPKQSKEYTQVRR